MSLPGIKLDPNLACWVNLEGLHKSYPKYAHAALVVYFECGSPRRINMATDLSRIDVYLLEGETVDEVYQQVVTAIHVVGLKEPRVIRP